MIFFHAVASNKSYLHSCLRLAEEKLEENVLVCPLLFSFAYRKSCPCLWAYLHKRDLILDNLMIDSGAPTVRSKGIHIDLDNYAKFIKWIEANKWVKQVTPVSLDVIRRDESETEKCAEASLRNFLYFKEQGIDSIAVYHYREHRKWLDRILEHTSNVGLGGMAKLMQKRQRLEWLDNTWEYLQRQNIKGLKVHGFAQTSVSTMQRYPWHSVDSASAVMAAAMGSVYLPRFSSNGYDYTRYFSISAGEKLPTRWRDHADYLCGPVKEEIANYLDSIGFQYRDLFDHYKRIAINVRFFTNFVNEVKQ